MATKFTNKKLSKRDKKRLLELAEHSWRRLFPNHSRDFLRSERLRLINQSPIEEKIKNEFESRSLRKTADEIRKKFNFLMEQNEELKKLLDHQIALKDFLQIYEIKPYKSSDSNEATACVLLSDWHIDERVETSAVNFLNKFDYSVAESRVKETFQTITRMLSIFKRDIEIKNLVIALLGDFISGSIHDDLKENNTMLTMDAVWKAQNLLLSGIKHLLETTDVNLIIPCSPGNHSRITEKQRVSTEHGNSLETLIYKNLALYFEKEKRVNFIITDSYHTYVDIYSYKIRFHHGHSIQYQGGIGGLFIPAFKAISQWNKGIPAYLDCFAHFHQYKFGGNFLCNGSLIGFNQYAIKIKADFSKPSQTFFLIDKKRGLTVQAPIVLNGLH